MPCPYLPGRIERRVVCELVGQDALNLYHRLSLAGFRRGHSIAYSPACPDCSACVSVRVIVNDFLPSRSQRRVLRRNSKVTAMEVPPRATEEQFTLFSAYQGVRHKGGEMEKMDFGDYQALVEDSPVRTALIEFRDSANALAGACIFDLVGDGISAVYSFFNPHSPRQCMGTYMILWLIERARRLNLDYVYLGFWIEDCQKMAYKTDFQPLEGYSPEGWKMLSFQAC